MKVNRLLVISLFSLITSSTYGQIRVIKCQILKKDLSSRIYSSVNSDTILLSENGDSINSPIDYKGKFIIDLEENNCKTIEFIFHEYATLKVVNVPIDNDTIDLGLVELIKHRIMPTISYNALKNSIIQENQNKLIKTDYESALSKRYHPIIDPICKTIIGYLCINELECNQMSNPLNNKIKMKINFDPNNDMIILDYKYLILNALL